MWVEPTPAMSAATGDTRDSLSYQDFSMGSRDSAKAATAAPTNAGASSASQAPSAAMMRARASSAGSNSWRRFRNASTRRRRAVLEYRASAVASMDVNTRNGLRASSFESTGRNAVDTTGTGDRADRKS